MNIFSIKLYKERKKELINVCQNKFDKDGLPQVYQIGENTNEDWEFNIQPFKNGFSKIMRREDGLFNIIDEEYNLVLGYWCIDIDYVDEKGFVEVQRKYDQVYSKINIKNKRM